jgi:hypothetical protein
MLRHSCALLGSGAQIAGCVGGCNAARTESLEPWDLTTADHDELALCIAGLERKHCLAITRAYKPWTIPSIAHDLGMYHVTDRTWRTWAHAAGLELAEKMGLLDRA